MYKFFEIVAKGRNFEFYNNYLIYKTCQKSKLSLLMQPFIVESSQIWNIFFANATFTKYIYTQYFYLGL